MMKSRLDFPKQIWVHLIRPYWTSHEKWSACGLLGGYLILMGIFIAVSVQLNYWHNDFYTALQKLDINAFFKLLGIFLGWAFLSIIVFITKNYLLQTLEVRWRSWMTRHSLETWMKNRRYYALQLQGNGSDNPDQRISDDISSFINISLSMMLGLFQQVITLISFFGILWSLSGTLRFSLGGVLISIPGYMCWGAILYAVAGTFLSFYFGRGLTKLSYEHEKREANFRYSLIRFRDNSEGIAFYQGEKREQGIFQDRFQQINQNAYAVIKQMLVMNSWGSFYGQWQALLPALLAAPRFFAKEVTFGSLMQIFSAFKQVSDSLSFIITNYVGITAWRATTVRLLEFTMSLSGELPPATLAHVRHWEDGLEVMCDHLSLPHGGRLQENIRLSVAPGDHTLISGPTGTGKSTLARAIAGLWPYGKGEIRIPAGDFLFLPQKPYLPLGSLKEVLLYPKSEASLEELCDGLDAVGLGSFKPRLGEVNDWARVLSLGEQQRVAILRALLAKPHWLVMDEATSAMDEASEAHLYGLLKQTLPETTLVSIGHRESLKTLHVQEMRLGVVAEKAAVFGVAV